MGVVCEMLFVTEDVVGCWEEEENEEGLHYLYLFEPLWPNVLFAHNAFLRPYLNIVLSLSIAFEFNA